MQQRSRKSSDFGFSLSFFLVTCLSFCKGGIAAPSAITPIPMELLNPRLTEFRRMDSNSDDQISFSEYLQSDRPWMETLSRRYHQLDMNSDGRVTRKEFETFFRGKDEEHERQHAQADNFFKQLTVTVGPIVEREQVGNASNGASKTHFFSARARKYAATAHGTGLFPPTSASLSSNSSPINSISPSSAADLSPEVALLRDHNQHFRLFSGPSSSSSIDFPHHHHLRHGQHSPNPFLPSTLLGARHGPSTSLTESQQPVDSQNQQQSNMAVNGIRPLMKASSAAGMADMNGQE